jgi:glycosyltransferase involved in cell wall biosynthesis
LSAAVERNLPAVSAIVTNYNHGRFLRRRMESVLGQTLSPLEVIYLDDCSADDSKEVIAPFEADARLRCIENERNSGSPFVQINRGVRLARAELIWVAEADDYADPRFLETLVPIFAQNPSVSVAYCQSMQIDEDGAELSVVDYSGLPDAGRWHRNYVANGLEECRRYLLFRNTIPNFSAVVFRKKIFEEIGYADESMRLSGDWFIWIKMLMRCDIAYVAAPLNYYRQHGASVRRRTDVASHMREVYRVADYCREHLPFSDAEWDVMLTRIMKFWLRNCLDKGAGAKRFGQFLRVCEVARRSDSRFFGRLLWCLADRLSFGATLRARRRLGWGALTRLPNSPT